MCAVTIGPFRRLCAATHHDRFILVKGHNPGRKFRALMGAVTVRTILRLATHAKSYFITSLDLNGEGVALPSCHRLLLFRPPF